ncbi:hypothetical protein K1Y78_37525 [Streptomyces sp. tea 10]|nr:hypothetical protein [Streptomyces sp. tea 10]
MLIFAITCLTSHDSLLVWSVYAVMGPIGWFVFVPLCLASLAAGFVSSLGTAWGLFRYERVRIKLVITRLSTLVLLIHTSPIDRISQMARPRRDPAANSKGCGPNSSSNPLPPGGTTGSDSTVRVQTAGPHPVRAAQSARDATPSPLSGRVRATGHLRLGPTSWALRPLWRSG